MSTVLRFRRGDTSAANAFTGAEGELYVDTTKDTLVVHDGVTLGGKPLATEEYVQNQGYLTPTSSIDWNQVTNTPTLFSGSYNDLTNKPVLFDGNYNSLSNLPTLFSGSYNDLTNTPTLFSGKYEDLTEKPTFKTINGNSILGSGDITISGSGFSGSYNDLTDKPTIPAKTGDLINDSGFITSSALTGYATESYVTTELESKQNTLISGSNIKTINGQSLLGGGNITISGEGGGSALVYGQFTDNTVALTTTAASQVIDSYPADIYRTSKYIVQAVCDEVGIHSTELMIIHDGSTVYISEYATVYTNGSLFTVDANISGDPAQVEVTVTPTNALTTFDVVRTSLAARTFTPPSLEGDLMTLSGTEDLQTASGTVDLNS
jgi:hypothetical protein